MAREAAVRKALERTREKALSRRPLSIPLPAPVSRALGSRLLLAVAFSFVAGSVITAKVVHDSDELRIRRGLSRVSRNVATCVASGRSLEFSDPAPFCVDRDGSRVSTAEIAIPAAIAPAPPKTAGVGPGAAPGAPGIRRPRTVDMEAALDASRANASFARLPRDRAGRVVEPRPVLGSR